VNKNARFLPLRVKLAIAFALVSILAVGSTTYFYYRNARAQLWQGIRERLVNSVAIAALQVDAEAHSQLTDPSQEGNPTYLQLKKTLQKIRDAGTNIEFVYTMRPDGQGNLMFVVDAEESEEDVSHLGDLYPDAGPVLAANFLTMSEPMLEDDIYTDEWGDHLSGYAPFYTADGRREGILGMDISANDITALERQILLNSAKIFFGSFLTLAIIGWFVGTALSAPLSRLTQSAEKFAGGNFDERVQISTHDEVEILANAFNATAEKLSDLVTGLEQRVEERTTALTRRTSQIQTAARVARDAAAIKDTSTLLNNAVRLISDQFGFYHAGIFLLDETGDFAVLQAASSPGGQQMLARGHRLQVGKQGIVGFVAAQKRSRIALDTGVDAVYFNNPDLPETRSEAALPLVVRDRVIGVLDIQSEKPQAFSPEDIETFQTLADQLALAIENARLFQEMNLAVQQLQQVAAERAGNAWKEIAQAQGHAYRYTPLGIQPATREYSPANDAGRHHIPILLHNRKIGEIKVKRKEEAETLDPREQAMLKEIATQVALALENARLLEEAQQRAAYERSISDIIARIDAAHDVDAILRITAQEIGKAIGDSEVTVQIRPQNRETA
jgi:GAF domain-containing protein/HAMP domain-containing protein